MKKPIIISFLFLGIIHLTLGANWTSINSTNPTPANVQLLSSTVDRSVVRFSMDGFYQQVVLTPRGEAVVIAVDNGTPILAGGSPDLPRLTGSLIIPDMARMDVKVIASLYTDFTDILVAPSKGSFSRDIDPASIPYQYGKVYDHDGFFPQTLAELGSPYILRDFRGQTIIVYPFQYNPVTHILRVYKEITVEVKKVGNDGSNPFHRVNEITEINSEFQWIYDRHFLNSSDIRYTPLDDHGNMLIISYGDFIAAMQPFVDWKIKTGMPTEIVDVATIGDATAIKTFVENYYNSNGLTFLLLVGDAAQVPSHPYGGVNESDNSYGFLSGNDSYPELFVGRFSAENVDEVTTQVERTLIYEQNPPTSTDWFSTGIGIASSQGTGDDNEYDWEHSRNLRTQLLDYTYTQCAELYDGDQGGEDLPGNPSPQMVADKVNAGASIINYTGHGSTQSWGTSGFSNPDVDALTNTNMLPFIWSVACVNGAFAYGTCFAEAWLRATDDSGQPTGAIAAFMSTISQDWDPPMEGQDEMVAILVESYQDNIKRTFAGISMNGCMKMNDSYGSGGSTETNAWTTFGDPSLVVRTAFPQTLTVTHDAVLLLGSSQFSINCSTDGALVALTTGNTIFGTATIQNGSAIIEFDPLTELDTLSVVVTAYNYLPYTADVEVIPANGPYVVFDAYEINDAAGNGNGQLDNGEAANLNFSVKNIGTENASNVSITIASADPYVTITDNTADFGTVPSGGAVMITDAFSIQVTPDIPDLHVITFSMEATSTRRDTWTSNFNIIAHAPSIEFASLSINDLTGNNNGKLDPGETAKITITVTNAGSSDAADVQGMLASGDPNVTILENFMPYESIPVGGSAAQIYTVTADMLTPPGHSASFNFTMIATPGSMTSSSFDIIIGQIPVLIIDLDNNHSSGPVIQTTLQDIGIAAEYFTNLPVNMSLYSSIFVCLGIYYDNYVLSQADGQALAAYLNDGGNLYMEGGDTWAFNEQTAVHAMFNIQGVNDGSANMTILNGATGTFAEGMSFSYSGENAYMDQLEPIAPAYAVFKNSSPEYTAAVAYDAGNYKTIGTSFEFAGLTDGTSPSTKDELMQEIIDFFGIGQFPTGIVSGVVTDADNGTPVVGAEIKVGSYVALSGDNGSFTGTFPTGEWPLCASAQGFETNCETVTIYGDSTIIHNFSLVFLTAPYDLEASLAQNIVTLTWNIDNDGMFQYFCIYRSKNDDQFALLATTTENGYNDVLSSAGNYHYYVTAMYDNNSESLPSETITIEYTATGIPGDDNTSTVTKLGTNYPNPFTDETTIRYSLKSNSEVLIEIYKLTGEKIKTLVDETMKAGLHEVAWDCTDDFNRQVSKGIYFYQMKAGDHLSTRKMVLMK
jgi:hypothetical protein